MEFLEILARNREDRIAPDFSSRRRYPRSFAANAFFILYR